MKFFLLLAISVITCGYCDEKSLFRLDSDAGFSFYADKDDAYSRKFLKILDLCSKNITDTIGKKKNEQFTRFFLYEEKPLNLTHKKHLVFTHTDIRKLDYISLIFLVNKGLLKAHFESESIPDWINASILHNALHIKNDFLHLQNRYVFTRYLVAKDLEYKLTFLEHIDAIETAPYLVKMAYMEQSKVLSRIIFRNKQLKNQVFTIISRNQYNHSFIYDSLRELARKKNIAFNLWLQDEVQKIVFNSMYPIGSDKILKKLDELSNLTVSRKNNLGQYELVQLPLEELDTYKTLNKKHYITLIVFKFAHIYNKSPFYLKASLLQIQDALVNFTKGKKSDYKKNILKAKKDIRFEYELEKKRHAWFKEVERQKYKSARIFPELLNQFDDSRNAKEKTFPGAYKWYRELEQRMK
ncbi:hypothetical protein PQO01_08475 [Lentisphaera marina]|uniref:hypothetical protein n=1 Tax=Lentisphaera marina TaxID=1111041 RepID=UPI0023652CE8|nr:hypothetical protein [Lentisphaera marina]MDD7984979.1 hypothetical protein [Lentisphaera marina]